MSLNLKDSLDHDVLLTSSPRPTSPRRCASTRPPPPAADNRGRSPVSDVEASDEASDGDEVSSTGTGAWSLGTAFVHGEDRTHTDQSDLDEDDAVAHLNKAVRSAQLIGGRGASGGAMDMGTRPKSTSLPIDKTKRNDEHSSTRRRPKPSLSVPTISSSAIREEGWTTTTTGATNGRSAIKGNDSNPRLSFYSTSPITSTSSLSSAPPSSSSETLQFNPSSPFSPSPTSYHHSYPSLSSPPLASLEPRASISSTTSSSGSFHALQSPIRAHSIDASELAYKLEQHGRGGSKVLVVDLRPLAGFLGHRGRIRGSININFPSLLLRRLRKSINAPHHSTSFNLSQFVTTDTGKTLFESMKSPYDAVVVGSKEEETSGEVAEVLVKILERRSEVSDVRVLEGSLETVWDRVGREWKVIGESAEEEEKMDASIERNGHEVGLAPLPISPPRARASTTTAVRNERHEPMTPTFTTQLSLPPHLALSPRSSIRKVRALRLDTSDSSLGTNRASTDGGGAPSAPPTMTPPRSLQSLCRQQARHRESPEKPVDLGVGGGSGVEGEVFDPSTIIPSFLFLGPEPTCSTHIRQLQSMGVTTILNLAIECVHPLARTTFSPKHHHLPLRDVIEEKGIQSILIRTCDLIDSCRHQNESIYVHCRAGKSRSVMVVVAWLVRSRKCTLNEAYEWVTQRRQGVSPNIGFVAELMKWEDKVLGKERRRREEPGAAGMVRATTDQGGEGWTT